MTTFYQFWGRLRACTSTNKNPESQVNCQILIFLNPVIQFEIRYFIRLTKGSNRSSPTLVADALEALDRLVSLQDSQQEGMNLASLQEDIEQTRNETSNIFEFE
jgi:hypothetical protein